MGRGNSHKICADPLRPIERAFFCPPPGSSRPNAKLADAANKQRARSKKDQTNIVALDDLIIWSLRVVIKSLCWKTASCAWLAHPRSS